MRFAVDRAHDPIKRYRVPIGARQNAFAVANTFFDRSRGHRFMARFDRKQRGIATAQEIGAELGAQIPCDARRFRRVGRDPIMRHQKIHLRCQRFDFNRFQRSVPRENHR
nr:hypothetical protein [Negativicoccus succinicivorans]